MSTPKKVFLYLFSLSYIGAGIMHFINPDFYIRIMPPYFPEPAFWVYLTGVIEIGLGALVLVPRFRKMAAWSVIAMLVAFLPVHVYMLQNSEQFADLGPEIGLWLRFPIQGLMIAYAWWFTRGDDVQEDSAMP